MPYNSDFTSELPPHPRIHGRLTPPAPPTTTAAPATHAQNAGVDVESCRTVSDCHHRIVRFFDEERRSTARGGLHGDEARDYYLDTAHLIFQYCERKRVSPSSDHPSPPKPNPKPKPPTPTSNPNKKTTTTTTSWPSDPEPDSGDRRGVSAPPRTRDGAAAAAASTETTGRGRRRPGRDRSRGRGSGRRRNRRFFDVSDVGEGELTMDAIVQRYNSTVDPISSATPVVRRAGPYEACEACGRENTLVLRQSDSVIVCTECGACVYAPVLHSRPSYRTTRTSPTTMTLYKRINHFDDWISQFQAKETIVVPVQVYRKIAFELRKRSCARGDATPQTIRSILRKLKLNKYYEHIPRIMNRLQGTPPPTIDRHTENQLRTMFRLIQEPFARHSPSTRRNFSSYSYILSKFFGLLGRRDLQRHFPLLKSRTKLYAQDTIWRGICRDLGWRFEPSM